ncbi:MAG: hypothetical protein U1F77_04760 [Kiritimatiellia bacterium]
MTLLVIHLYKENGAISLCNATFIGAYHGRADRGMSGAGVIRTSAPGWPRCGNQLSGGGEKGANLKSEI